MAEAEAKEEIENLALLLLYLTNWDENPKGKYGEGAILMAWKGLKKSFLAPQEN